MTFRVRRREVRLRKAVEECGEVPTMRDFFTGRQIASVAESEFRRDFLMRGFLYSPSPTAQDGLKFAK